MLKDREKRYRIRVWRSSFFVGWCRSIQQKKNNIICGKEEERVERVEVVDRVLADQPKNARNTSWEISNIIEKIGNGCVLLDLLILFVILTELLTFVLLTVLTATGLDSLGLLISTSIFFTYALLSFFYYLDFTLDYFIIYWISIYLYLYLHYLYLV